MARRVIIAGNWKMHHNHLEAIQVTQKLSYLLDKEDYEQTDVVLCPPFTDLRGMQTLIDADRLKFDLGAQNCHWELHGAYTGEISPAFLAKLQVKYVIVGHSERRELFRETDDDVNRKVVAVLGQTMTPIVCVGETLAEREAGETNAKVDGQVRAAFAGIKGDVVEGCVIAYEPIWAIGTGRTATPDDANETCGVIRNTVRAVYGDSVADDVRIQYGGSVKPGNAADLMGQPEIDGALVGGASLDPEDFSKIIRYR